MGLLTLDTIYRDVIDGIANKDQNQHYPPHVRDQHVNLITNALIDECVKLYPTNNYIISVLQPFIETKELKVVGGMVPFPDNYRNFLSMGVYVRDAEVGSSAITPCCANGFKICEQETDNDPISTPTVADIKIKALARTCRSNPVNEMTINEWDLATGHAYKKPTIDNPMCCIFSGKGITINPYNVEQVVLRYVRIPKVYKYGFTLLPDETDQFDASTTEESEWHTTARKYINSGMNTLYSIFARDGEMRDGNMEIKKISFF